MCLICHAAKLGKVDMLPYLLSLGCEERTLNQALVYAFKAGSLQSVKLLLDAGADFVDYLNEDECMSWACAYGK